MTERWTEGQAEEYNKDKAHNPQRRRVEGDPQDAQHNKTRHIDRNVQKEAGEEAADREKGDGIHQAPWEDAEKEERRRERRMKKQIEKAMRRAERRNERRLKREMDAIKEAPERKPSDETNAVSSEAASPLLLQKSMRGPFRMEDESDAQEYVSLEEIQDLSIHYSESGPHVQEYNGPGEIVSSRDVSPDAVDSSQSGVIYNGVSNIENATSSVFSALEGISNSTASESMGSVLGIIDNVESIERAPEGINDISDHIGGSANTSSQSVPAIINDASDGNISIIAQKVPLTSQAAYSGSLSYSDISGTVLGLADTSDDRSDSIPSIYTYLMAKYKVEQDEINKLKQEVRPERVSVACSVRISHWANNKHMKALGHDKEIITESIVSADERSLQNEAYIPPREPAKIVEYMYTDTIKDIAARHNNNMKVYIYAGDEEKLKTAFLKIGKNFKEIRKEYLPEYSSKDVVKIYYKMKYKLRLKDWSMRDTRKIQDKDLAEIISREWTAAEKEAFHNLYEELGKKWKEYCQHIPGKREIDMRIYYRYYKKMQKKEVPKKKEKREKEGKEEGEWQVHERQTFALLFPHIGKNWSVLANYIVTKTAAEIRSYHRVYYKHLRAGERILEIYLKDIGEKQVRTDPLILHERSGHRQQHSRHAGVLFSCK
ncbi:hypothetical protein NEIG_00286 [Nematocida sp. ERTm5]|nr:hypothetical protein NEIG_00286 [Nematocida sp. ERTm5]